MKIIYGEFKHETSSLSPTPANLKAYQESYYLWDDEISAFFKGTRSEIGGFLDAFAQERISP